MNDIDNVDWPFCGGGGSKQVTGMGLPKYLEWASGNGDNKKKLFLPSIQRGFVWKPKQIVDLWDSLLKGMPIGSLMLTHLSEGQEARSFNTNETNEISNNAIGLLDGQQRTLAMLLGWPCELPSQHCMWIDLGEIGQGGSGLPFELRITSKTQPFGFQRFAHVRLSRHDRKEARKKFDEKYPEYKIKRDYELFELNEKEQPRPWKTDKNVAHFVRLKDAWNAFRKANDRVKFIEHFNCFFLPLKVSEDKITSLYESLCLMESLEVPLVLIPEHISQSQSKSENLFISNAFPDPLILLFERIGQNGARLTPDDLLFSMIKQQWPKAHDLVEDQLNSKAGRLMSSIDYVATAYRLGSAEIGIADNPRPNPNDFHRHLENLLGKNSDNPLLPLRKYLKEHTLVSAFNYLYEILVYKGDNKDIGLPELMLPYLSRGLIQVLLRWIMLNHDNAEVIDASRKDVIAFVLFWYLCVWNEDKASKKAFELVKPGPFPAIELYKHLTYSPKNDEVGLMLSLVSPERLDDILVTNESPLLRSKSGIFKEDNTINASFQERELYKRFCWDRKHLLLWLQRSYVQNDISKYLPSQFFGLTDEEAVPYDYDHLCPQNHWGADWRNIIRNSSIAQNPKIEKAFKSGKNDVGNCIGNFHVLESSLNRSFGDDPLEAKLNSPKWKCADSLLYLHPKNEHEKLWKLASPSIDSEDECYKWRWDEIRLSSFQSAVYRRAFGLYGQIYEICSTIIPSD